MSWYEAHNGWYEWERGSGGPGAVLAQFERQRAGHGIVDISGVRPHHNGRFGTALTGAAYQPVVDAIRQGSMPEYILVEFDMRFGTVVFVDAVPGRLITEERVIPRKPLAATARRAGWRGCAGGCDFRCRGAPARHSDG